MEGIKKNMKKSKGMQLGITENDIKFAENKLPNFLEGAMLDGKIWL